MTNYGLKPRSMSAWYVNPDIVMPDEECKRHSLGRRCFSKDKYRNLNNLLAGQYFNKDIRVQSHQAYDQGLNNQSR